MMTGVMKKSVVGKTKERNSNYGYIEFRVHRESSETLDKYTYIQNVTNRTVNLSRAENKEVVLTLEGRKNYRQLIGYLKQRAQGTKQDIEFELIHVHHSTKLKDGTIGDLSRVTIHTNYIKQLVRCNTMAESCSF